MNGAQRLLQEQAQVTNGLANISTTGFKQQLNLQRAVPLQGGAAYPTRVSTVSSTVGTHMAQGPMSETGHALDLAIQGEGRSEERREGKRVELGGSRRRKREKQKENGSRQPRKTGKDERNTKSR